MTHVISVEGMKFYAYHGCLEEEAKIGGHYIVDVHLETDFTEAAQTDDLSKTLDYCAVQSIAKKEMAVRSKLIEQVAQRIYSGILQEFGTIKKCRVKVIKLNPPMNAEVDRVSVEISA
jgi:dihydroneopterin aldolase